MKNCCRYSLTDGLMKEDSKSGGGNDLKRWQYIGITFMNPFTLINSLPWLQAVLKRVLSSFDEGFDTYAKQRLLVITHIYRYEFET